MSSATMKSQTAWGRISGWLRSGRHPIRAGALALATVSIFYGMTSGAGLTGAVIGAVSGMIVGEFLGRSRLRLSMSLVGLALLAFVGTGIADFAVQSEFLPEMLGPGGALTFSVAIRFVTITFVVCSGLRLLAIRQPAFLGLELGLVAAAFTVAFSAHRDGGIARPLWLSDWAWQQGLNPSDVLTWIGAGAVVLLAVLLIAESKSRLSIASIVALPLLALLGSLLIEVTEPPPPEAGNDLGLTDTSEGDDPILDDEDGNPSEHGQEDDQDDPDAGEQSAEYEVREEQDGGASGFELIEVGIGQTSQDTGEGGGSANQLEEQLENPTPPDGGTPAPMAVVLLGDDYSPPAQGFYFRQEAWSHFNGSRLVAAQSLNVDMDTRNRFPTVETPVRGVPEEYGRRRVQTQVAMLTNHTRPFGLETPVWFAPTVNPNPEMFVRTYELESLALDLPWRELFGYEAGDLDWSERVWDHYLAGPSDPRYLELAERIITDEVPDDRADDPFLRVLAIKFWLDEHLTYSTAERHAGVDDPTADFLFGNQIGYCVHFAHAAVYLWRSLGIPARVGTGYYVTEDQMVGTNIIIRSSDAHAWPEVYLDGVGWIVVDISAYRNLDPPGQPMDDALAILLGQMARAEPPDPFDPIDPLIDDQGRQVGANSPLGVMTRTGLYLALLAFLLLQGTKLWRRAVPMWASPKSLPRVGYRAALDILSQVGLHRQVGESREHFAQRIKNEVPSFLELTRMNVAATFCKPGNVPNNILSKDVWLAGLDKVQNEVGEIEAVWKRIGFIVSPVSFLNSR